LIEDFHGFSLLLVLVDAENNCPSISMIVPALHGVFTAAEGTP